MKKFAFIAKNISEDILKPYTFPKPVSLTAYGQMLHNNKKLFYKLKWNPADLIIFDGHLDNPGISSAVLTDDAVIVSFDTAQEKGSDIAIAVVYDEASPSVFYNTAKRSEGSVKVPISKIASKDKASLHAYLVFSRPPARNARKKGFNSITAYQKIECP